MIPIISALGLIMTVTMAQAGPFDELTWRNRLLVVFDQGDGRRASAQHRMLLPSGNEARDLLVVDVPQSGLVEAVPGKRIDATAARRAFGIADDAPFTVLLVGKDGGVKLRSQEPVSAQQLFDTVDAMPMRRREAQGG